MIWLYIIIMSGWQVRKLENGRFAVRTSPTSCDPSGWPCLDRKGLDQMMYFYVVVMDGWQVRKIPKVYEDGKPRFELLRGHT